MRQKNHPVEITDTTFRDAHQSLWATRMRTEDMAPIAEMLDKVGYHSLEVWGGATFDVCMRFLNEDPWVRLRTLKKLITKTPLQMLLRGQSLVGYQHYADDVVSAFVHKAVENGIDIIRIFDALNDIRNFEVPIREAKKAGAHVQAAVVYTISPVHTVDYFLNMALQLQQMGADSLCIKDMAGLLSPYVAYDLVKLFKKKLTIPVQLHCHYIGGLAVGTYLKAVEAGVDVIDTASVPLAFGASQPPVETVVRALKESPYDSRLDIHLLFEVAKYFEELRKKNGFERGVTRITDMRVFDHQVPGGMISNFVAQLEQQKALHRIHDVLAEIPRVRADLGYPPLVTPTSQFMGAQAVLNILSGQRYKLVPGEVKAYVQGHYGRTPAPIDPEIVEKILGPGAEIINCRPADLLEPRMDKIKDEIQDLATCVEDELSYALFPQVAKKFFEARLNRLDAEKVVEAEEEKQPPMAEDLAEEISPGSVSKEEIAVDLKEVKELIKIITENEIAEISLESGGTKISIKRGQIVTGTVPAAVPAAEKAATEQDEDEATLALNENLVAVTAPMVGTFYRTPAPDAAPFVEAGAMVTPGQTVCIIEAMKLMNEIEVEVSGRVVEVLVENGQAVEYGQTLFLIEPA